MAAFGQTRLVTIFKIPELRRKIFIPILFLAIYRIGFHVPLPIINQAEMMKAMRGSDEGLLGLISMFSGGSLSQSTIFGLGIMPYISASIIFQLLASVVPAATLPVAVMLTVPDALVPPAGSVTAAEGLSKAVTLVLAALVRLALVASAKVISFRPVLLNVTL
ncbi:hypothetical protein B4Q13_17175 [Lacticaseibacillus rhamnosus]